jgi:hypothetical protein
LIGGRLYTSVLLGGLLIAYAMYGGRTEHKILICKETQTEFSTLRQTEREMIFKEERKQSKHDITLSWHEWTENMGASKRSGRSVLLFVD